MMQVFLNQSVKCKLVHWSSCPWHLLFSFVVVWGNSTVCISMGTTGGWYLTDYVG